MSALPNYHDEHARIETALTCIPADLPRDEWARIGAALKHGLGDAGFDLFDTWSQRGESYDASAARSTWRSLSANGGITIGTLFHKAIEHGFDSRGGASHVDPAEAERHRAERDKRTAEKAREREVKAKCAAGLAEAVWLAATPVGADHPYLMRKGVQPMDSLREINAGSLETLIGYQPKRGDELLAGRILIAPVKVGGKLSTLEMIDGDGRKSALAGGAKVGGLWATQKLTAPLAVVLIAEGVATALSASQCTGYPAIASLSVGQMEAAARAMREHYPETALVLLADLDKTSGKPHPAAVKAAHAVGAKLAMPEFGPDRKPNETDFNDLHAARGTEAVRAGIEAAQTLEAGEPNQAQEFPAIDDRPCWRVYEDWQEIDGQRVKPGVYWHAIKPGKGDAPPDLVDKWICSPMWVVAVTRNREDAEYGRLLEVLSPAGKRKKWAMPMSMLAGDGNEVRSVLLSEGLTFDLNDRQAVPRYIAGQYPKRTMRAASVTGWHDGAFVLPQTVIGADDIWFQSTGREAPYATASTFEGWRELAALAQGNPLLMFAMSSAFAGPLLGPLNLDGGGAHFYGDSSCGKTTAARAAISVWGSPRFERKWRATSNGLEGSAALHSDTLLVLDEIGEIKPQDLYETAYALINGRGKTRANRHGEARQAARWRVFLLSTGELTVAARMAAGGIEAKAGQLVRILDIPVTGTYGVFETLHGRESGGVLSDEIRNMAATNYGHAGPRFVDALIRNLAGGLRLAELLAPLLDRFGKLGDQERRAARAFALCALAGELAIEWGVVPWSGGEPACAAIHAFRLWRAQWGVPGRSAEHAGILRAIADFIDRHGDSRFSNIEGSADLIRDRAGYWKQDGSRRLYLFTSSGLHEAAKGYDFHRVTRALDEAGALADTDTGKRSKTTRTQDGRTPRLYHIDLGALDRGSE